LGVLLLVVMFFLSTDRGALREQNQWTDWLALDSSSLKHGKIWALFTYALLHADVSHLLLNGVAVYFFGEKLRMILGVRQSFLAFLVGTLMGGGLFLFFDPGGEAGRVLVGASGGIMGLLILLVTLSPDSRMWPIPVSGLNAGLGMMIASALLILITPSLGVPLFSTVGEKVNEAIPGIFRVEHACHFGGGLAGFLFGRWVLRRPVSLETLQRQRMKREGGSMTNRETDLKSGRFVD